MVTTALMTAEELAQLPDDGYLYELVRGELRRMPPPKEEHGFLLARLTIHLGTHIGPQGRGRLLAGGSGFVFERDPDTVLAPDIAYIRAERVSGPPGPDYLEQVPDLVVEILSPSDRPGQVRKKVEAYQGFGVPLIWLLVPKRREVEVHPLNGQPTTLGIDDVLEGGDVLPGFSLAVRDLFGEQY